jgi:hypothetical protein
VTNFQKGPLTIVREGVALAALLFGCSVYAATPPGGQAFMEAANQFEQLAQVSSTQGTMPRLSDPKAAAVLRTLSNSPAALGTQTYDIHDVNGLLPVCRKGLEVMGAYMTSGVQQLKDKEGSDSQILPAKIKALGRTNLGVYQDELVPVVAFNIQCMARLLSAETTFFLKSPAQQITPPEKAEALATSKLFGRLMPLFLDLGSNPAFRPPNQRLILNALGNNADAYAQVLRIDQRAQMLKTALAARQRSPIILQPQFDPVISAMRNTRCIGVCAL